MSDKDKAHNDSDVIHELFSEWCGEGTIGFLKHKLAEYVATVRREVWNEMFKIQCVDCAEGDEPIYSKEARWFYHGISNQEVGCSASKLRIAALERAAGSGEGESDG